MIDNCIGCFNISESNGFTSFYDGYATLDMEGQWSEWDMGKIYFCPVCGRSLRDLALIMRADRVELTAHIKHIFNAARFESFEAGMDSNFSRALMPLLDSKAVIFIIADMIDAVCPDTASEALRYIGRADCSGTHGSRLALLVHCLHSSSHYIRDGAGIGLDSLGDPAAIQALQEAIERESDGWMVRNFELVIKDLEK